MTRLKQAAHDDRIRYGVGLACLTCLVRPVRAVRSADHLPLGKAWAVHLAGAGLTAGVILVLVGWSEVDGRGTPARVVHSVAGLLAKLAEAFTHPGAWAFGLLCLLLIESAWSVSALVGMSWSARDEPWRQSYRRSLRRLYLLTPHLATLVALAGGAGVWVNRVSRYQPRLAYEFGYVFVALGYAAVVLWSLGVVLVALGVRRPPASCRWPARCMDCGYELAGVASGRDCPECGLAVSRSLASDGRPGVPTPGGLLGWLRVSRLALRRPTELGRRMHVLSPELGPGRCLAWSIGALMFASPPAMGVIYLVVETLERTATGTGGARDWGEALFVSSVVGSWMGLATSGTLVLSALLGAGIVGLVEGWAHGRHLMPAAIRAACYQSGLAVAWALVFWCNLTLMMVLETLDLLAPSPTRHSLGPEELGMLWLGSVVLTGIGIYVALIGRATRAARFANW